jgi:hypothetical protein
MIRITIGQDNGGNRTITACTGMEGGTLLNLRPDIGGDIDEDIVDSICSETGGFLGTGKGAN